MQLHELLSVGMVILLGLLGGKLSHRLKIPRVTGYMLTGLLFGPSLLKFISATTLNDIQILNEVALGLILFAIGGEIELNHLRAMGRKVILIGLAESFGAFLLVFVVSSLLTRDVGLSAILGSISMATAPGVILLVIREYRTSGPLTDTLLAVVALNNVICIVFFRIIFSAYTLAQGGAVGETLISIGQELIGSVLLGGAIAAGITFWEQHIDDLAELLLVIVGGLLLGIGVAKSLGMSQLLVCLVVGAVTNNLSMMHRLVYAELRQTEMPFYIAFFVLSGASLHLDLLASLGFLGLGYLFARPLGKFIGSRMAARRFKAVPEVTNNLGLALLPQAGVAIGLAMTVSAANPRIGQVIATVVLSSVIIYEGIGPFMTKLALARGEELNPED